MYYFMLRVVSILTPVYRYHKYACLVVFSSFDPIVAQELKKKFKVNIFTFYLKLCPSLIFLTEYKKKQVTFTFVGLEWK